MLVYTRRVSGLQDYIDHSFVGGPLLQMRVLRSYLGGDNVGGDVLLLRAAVMDQVLQAWFQQVANL